MIKVYANRDSSGCGYWRLTLPTKFIDSTRFSITIGDMLPKNVEWFTKNNYKVLWTQRNHDMGSFQGIRELKKRGMRTVYDCDDDIFSVKRHNPASAVFGDPIARKCVAACMDIADVVTTTTKILARRFPREVVHIIPNAIDTSTFRPFTPNTKRLVWAGSATHWHDFKPVLPAIRAFLKHHADWKLICMGYLPSEFHTHPQVEWTSWRTLPLYLVDMTTLKADFAIIPLDDNDFNRAKSNLKWLEFSAAGIPCIVPKHEPYSDCAGVDKAAHSTMWLEPMERMASRPVMEKEVMVTDAQVVIEREFNVQKVAKLWESVLEGDKT